MNPFERKYKYWKWLYRNRRELKEYSRGHQVRLYNWGRPYEQDMWLFDFIEKRGLLDGKPHLKVALYSIFAPFWLNIFDDADIRIFVERENLHRPHLQKWNHHFLNNKRVDLTLGFDELHHSQYLRFPFWLMWNIFSPTSTYDDIKAQIEIYDAPANHSYRDRGFCTFICSHDDIGRREIYEQLGSIGKVDCAGALFHNTDKLQTIFHDNKLAFLRTYRFNLCPENSDTKGYVTEKLPEAIHAGCIPIYQGGRQQPDSDIFNTEAIIFVDLAQTNTDALCQIKELNSSESAYMSFASQPRFMPDAADRIWGGYFLPLENKLKEIIANL